ncbi:MAG: VOC family protein [Planctomycetia bacterium]|nr:VOC family protein [Planctomycetia bacterium]
MKELDPSIAYVGASGYLHLYFETDDIAALAAQYRANGVEFVKDVHDTAWSTREFVIRDDQGHTLYFGEPLEPSADSE